MDQVIISRVVHRWKVASEMPIGLPLEELVQSLAGARKFVDKLGETIGVLQGASILQSKVINDLGQDLSKQVQKLEAFVVAGQGLPELFREVERQAAGLLERDDVPDEELEEFNRKFSKELPKIRVAWKALQKLEDGNPAYALSDLVDTLESKSLKKLADQMDKIYNLYDEGPDLEQAEALIRDFTKDNFDTSAS